MDSIALWKITPIFLPTSKNLIIKVSVKSGGADGFFTSTSHTSWVTASAEGDFLIHFCLSKNVMGSFHYKAISFLLLLAHIFVIRTLGYRKLWQLNVCRHKAVYSSLHVQNVRQNKVTAGLYFLLKEQKVMAETVCMMKLCYSTG